MQGTLSRIPLPSQTQLDGYTNQVEANDGFGDTRPK